MARGSSLGRFIRSCRLERGLTTRGVEELTRSRPGLVSISHSNLIAIEQGLHVPSFDKIVTLGLVYNVPSQMFEDHLRRDMLAVAAEPPGRTSDELRTQAKQTVAAGDFAKALALYGELYATIEGSPIPPGEKCGDLAWVGLQAADCRVRLGLPRVAKNELEDILKLDGLPPEFEARVHHVLAETCRQLGNSRLAMTHAREAMAQARTLRDPRLLAQTLTTAANVADDRGETRTALANYEEALGLLEPLGDTDQTGRVLRNIGGCWERLGDLSRAADTTTRGVAAARASGDRFDLASGLANLARFHDLRRLNAEARAAAKEAKDLAQAENYGHVLFAAIFYLWRLSEVEAQAALGQVYLDRLHVLARHMATRTEELVEFEQLMARKMPTP